MGERFAGRYELVDHVGDGGGGSVWRAWDSRTGHYVAAKLLRQRDAGALLRFVREQSMRVQHPHVIAPRGWAAEDDDVLLTMDLVAGGSVATLLTDRGALPMPTVVVLVDQLLDALGAVHQAGLVHRDVKPANLLLEPTGTALPFLRLADFGIAVALDDARLTETGTVVGTPGYVAPEVLTGAAPDPRQDLWSVAVLARHLLTGVRPASELTGMPLPETGQQPLPAHVPDELRRWLRALAAADPADRPRDALTARYALRELDCWSHPLWQPGEQAAEVVDHLAELPPGWGPDGPQGPPDAGTARPGGSPAPARGLLAPQATVALPAVPAVRPPSPRAGRPRGRVVRLGAAAALVIVAVASFTLAVRAGTAGGPDPDAGVSPGVDAPPVAQPDERAGAPCDFTQVGQGRSVSDDEVITCTQDGAGYLWR